MERCPFCPKIYKRPQSFKNHLNKAHPDQVPLFNALMDDGMSKDEVEDDVLN
jgi:hypothetical protein